MSGLDVSGMNKKSKDTMIPAIPINFGNVAALNGAFISNA